MFKRLLLVASAVFAYGSNLTLKTTNKVSHTPNYSYRYELDKQYDSMFLTNLVYNWDLLRDIEGDNIPDGFTYTNATNITLSGGIAKFTATARYGCIRQLNVLDIVNGNIYYFYSKVKTITNSCVMLLSGIGQGVGIVSNGNWQFTSKMFTASADYTGTGVRINDDSTSDWTPIEIDYIGVINLTATYGAGNEPSKEQLDPIVEFGYVPGCRQGYDDGYYDGQYDGYNDGHEDGYNDGLYDGYNDGYSDGYRDGDEWGYQDGYNDGHKDGYDIGFADAEAFADGSWLGSLVFGTVGGIVGFLFALSDFEVLGVSIMSIITLFVAIGIVKLLLKVLK